MVKVKQVLRIVIGSSIGVYIGKWLWLWQDYRANPGLYALSSAPWYTQMLPYTVMAAAIVLLEVIAYIVVHQAEKRREDQ